MLTAHNSKNDTLLNLHRYLLLKGKKFSNSINRFHLYDWIKGDWVFFVSLFISVFSIQTFIS